MKPPIVRPYEHPPGPPAPTPLPPAASYVPLFVVGGVLVVIGIGHETFSNPLVPIWQVFQIVPIGIGLAVGSAIIRERYHAIWGILLATIAVLYIGYFTIVNKTSMLPLFLWTGVHSLTRATIQLSKSRT